MQKEIIPLHWESKANNVVQCHLCPHHCTLIPNQTGKCGVRINQDGHLQSSVLNTCVSSHVDPIEKKPLYHFHPASKAYSLATMGCNFSCDWCQNWQIAQLPSINGSVYGTPIPPPVHIEEAKKSQATSIAYTYTEPTIFFEYALQIMQLAQQNQLHNLFISNGFITQPALQDLLPHLSAANIDLKAFSNRTYQKHVNGRLQPVLDSMKTLKQAGIWLEVTTLLIPTINDSEQELHDIATFIHQELSPDTPWHISRFVPMHRLKHLPPTPVSTLKKAKQIAQEIGLQYVYMGNVFDHHSHTFCPSCKKILVHRTGYATYLPTPIQNNQCPHCHAHIAGHWE